ncbi:MAG: protein-L-isoaspartate O-methyltransferase [Pseudomonadota bacterium]
MNLEQARANMIEQQIRPWNVLDQTVLDVIAEVPRDAFVAPEHASLAYCDTTISLGGGQHMLNPNVEGRLLQSLALRGDESVLLVGTGSGYVCACLAKLARSVRAVDINADFTAAAQARLDKLGINNVTLETGDACSGWAGDEQFDAIAISGAVSSIPESYAQQLTVGGRLFAIIGEADQPIMQAMLITRATQDRFETESMFETRASCLTVPASADKFVF